MKLSEKLEELTRENTVAELGQMLAYAKASQMAPDAVPKFAHAHVSISWGGQRLVTVDGYEGSVETNELAAKYLKAEPFQINTKSSPQDRLACYGLWERVQQLYTDNDAELAKTYIYKYVVPVKEFKPPFVPADPMTIIRTRKGKRETLFDFEPEEFIKLWPPGLREGISWVGDGPEKLRWVASKQMVERAVAAELQRIANEMLARDAAAESNKKEKS